MVSQGVINEEGKVTNFIPSIKPKAQLELDVTISPFLQFKEDGFVDFMFNGLFTQPVLIPPHSISPFVYILLIVWRSWPQMTVGQKDGKVTITIDVPGVEKVRWQTLGNQVFIRFPQCPSWVCSFPQPPDREGSTHAEAVGMYRVTLTACSVRKDSLAVSRSISRCPTSSLTEVRPLIATRTASSLSSSPKRISSSEIAFPFLFFFFLSVVSYQFSQIVCKEMKFLPWGQTFFFLFLFPVPERKQIIWGDPRGGGTGTKMAERPIVFFDVSVGGHAVGRVKMELFSDIVPKTAENFRYRSSLWDSDLSI